MSFAASRNGITYRKLGMQSRIQLLTATQLAYILRLSELTVDAMTNSGIIPHNYLQDKLSDARLLRYSPNVITGWLKQGPMLALDEKKQLDRMRSYYQRAFPDAIRELHEFEKRLAFVVQPKGYSLSPVKSKKFGFLYYVRYLENGKVVPSRWCTHTNDRAVAERFARDNRERILVEYRRRKDEGLYSVLRQFYQKNSPYLEDEQWRGRVIGNESRSMYLNFVEKVLIPFLRENGIARFEEITPPVINRLQKYLLKKGNKPQTINRYMSCIKAVINHQVMNGKLSENVFVQATMLKESKHSHSIRGCHEIEALKGVFKKPWEDALSYLLCLMIYTTGMRNGEIEKMRAGNLVNHGGAMFVSIPESKTESGIRLVPLHPFVHRQLLDFAHRRAKPLGDYLLSAKGRHIQSHVYRKANDDMKDAINRLLEKKRKGSMKPQETENISFYSGRHFWKTLMNCEGLGDIEEYFMGHKVSGDVSKRYNHLDKRGKQNLVRKAKEVFRILDRHFF